MNHSDQEWIRLLRQNDPQTVADLWQMLFRFTGFKKYQQDEDIRDMARDAAVAAFHRILSRGVSQFRFTSSFESYCIVIFTREFNRIVVKKRPDSVMFDDEASPDSKASAVAKADIAMIEKRLQPCLDKLADKEREVIELRKQGLDPETAADQIGITRNYFHVLAHRAREKLLRCLQARGFENTSDLLGL